MATLQASADLINVGNESNDLALSEDHDASRQSVEAVVMESQQTHALSDDVGEWQPFATFTVELQQRRVKGQTERRTTVSHLEAGSGAYWSGIESARLHYWITSQLNQLVQSEDKTTMQSEFEAESRQEPETVASSTPDVEAKPEPEAARQPESAAEGQLEFATESQSTVETAPQSMLTAEAQPESAALAQPELAEGQLESATESQSAVETVPQSMLAAEAQLESEALTQPELAAEKPLEPVSEPEVEPEEIIQPMHAAEPLPESEAETMAGSGGEKATPTVVEIIQLKAAQPPQSGMPIMLERTKPLLMKSIRRGYPFALEVSFKLSGPGADGVAKEQAPYHSEFYMCNRMTGETLFLGKAPRNTLVEGELAYTSRLPEAMLQKPGMYRLQVVTELAEDLASPGYFEVPLLKVV